MADVRRFDRLGARDRGQLVLVTALVLASLFVVLALVLNAVIYTGNFATRSSAADDVRDAVQVRVTVTDELERAVDDVNRNASNLTDLHAALASEMTTWSDLASRHRATNARDLELAVATTNGTRIVQDDTARNLTAEPGTADWELVADAASLESFQLNASPSVSPQDPTNATAMAGEGVFRLVVASGSDQWTVFVYDDNATATVAVQDPAGTLSPACSATSSTASIDLVAGTIDGTPCDGLADLGAPTNLDVAFRSGDGATGSYTLFVTEGTVDEGNFAADDSASPYTTTTIYEASVELWYHSPTVAYHTTVSYTPEAADG